MTNKNDKNQRDKNTKLAHDRLPTMSVKQYGRLS